MQNDISKKNWVLIWVIGLAGQLCWNVENAWFSIWTTDISSEHNRGRLTERAATKLEAI